MKKSNDFELDIQFANLKDLFKLGDEKINEFDELSRVLLSYMSDLTLKGVKGDFIIEGIKLDLWKDRVYHLIERAGLLPEYIDVVDEDEGDLNDSEWYQEGDDWEFGESEPILTKIEADSILKTLNIKSI